MAGTEIPPSLPAVPPPTRAPTPRPRPAGAPKPSPKRRAGEDVVVDCAVYVDGRRQPPVVAKDALKEAKARGGFVWLGLYEPTEEELASISERYGLHPLAVEDAVYAHQRPKLEHYDDVLFMVLTTARYVEHDRLTATSEVVETGEVMVFVGSHYVITVRHGEHGGLSDLRRGLEEQPDLLCLGPASVLYAVADSVVDAFVDVLGHGAGDLHERVDDQVRDGVEDRGRAQAEKFALLLESGAQLPEP